MRLELIRSAVQKAFEQTEFENYLQRTTLSYRIRHLKKFHSTSFFKAESNPEIVLKLIDKTLAKENYVGLEVITKYLKGNRHFFDEETKNRLLQELMTKQSNTVFKGVNDKNAYDVLSVLKNKSEVYSFRTYLKTGDGKNVLSEKVHTNLYKQVSDKLDKVPNPEKFYQIVSAKKEIIMDDLVTKGFKVSKAEGEEIIRQFGDDVVHLMKMETFLKSKNNILHPEITKELLKKIQDQVSS